eukprot:NP_494235.1 Uncharacterized protein CELE_B0281.1 [Caenorhabditis elegans]
MYTSIKCSTIYPNKINIPYIAHSSPFQIDSSQFQDIGSLCLIKKFINASPCFLVPIAFHMSLCPKREISNYLSANENVVNKPNELGRKLDSELEKLKTSLLKTKKLQEKLERKVRTTSHRNVKNIRIILPKNKLMCRTCEEFGAHKDYTKELLISRAAELRRTLGCRLTQIKLNIQSYTEMTNKIYVSRLMNLQKP